MYNTATINKIDEYRIGDTTSLVDDIFNISFCTEDDLPEWEIINFKISNSYASRLSELYREYNKHMVPMLNREFNECMAPIVLAANTDFFPEKLIEISSEYNQFEKGWGILKKNFGDINDLISGSLKPFYRIRNNDKVFAFITNNFEIFSLVLSIPSTLRKYFENETFILDIFSVPEEENWEQLIVRIQTKLPVKEARKKLKTFRSEWWFNASEGFDDKLFVHIEYI